MVERITANYAGFDTKVTDATRKDLEALTSRLRAEAGGATEPRLEAILREWIGFFKDHHTQVVRITEQPAAPAASAEPAMPGPPERPDWTEAFLMARLQALGSRRAPVEGIWGIDGNRYRVGVLRTGNAPDAFAAVVLTTRADGWKPGHLKADIRISGADAFDVTYRMGDHSRRELHSALVADAALFKLDGLPAWNREWPAVQDRDIADRMFPSGQMFLRRLSPSTLWLRLPDFDDDKAKPLEELLKTNAAALDSVPNLIIDLRDNTGGGDYVYAPVLPLVYTRPVYTIGAEFRASQDNVDLRRALEAKLKDAPEVAAQLEEQARRMEANLGKYVLPGAQAFWITRFDAVRPFPRQVAVLIDGAASSGEQMLLDLRQSRKVTLFGQKHSAGILDFANVAGMNTPSGRFYVHWATSRSLRLPDDPVDPDGIAPDVPIPSDVKDPVQWVQRWLEQQPERR